MNLIQHFANATHSAHFDDVLREADKIARQLPRGGNLDKLLSYICVTKNSGGLISPSVFMAFFTAVNTYFENSTNNPKLQNLWDSLT